MVTREQHEALKRGCKDAMLLYVVGDFCELYFDDAERAAKLLGLVVTSMAKGDPVPMTGFPVHAKDIYIRDLLSKGLTVALVEQDRGELRHQVRGKPVVSVIGGESLVAESEARDGKSLNESE